MLKSQSKIVIGYFIILFFITSCAHASNKINETNNNESQSFFIIDFHVNLFKDNDSSVVLKTMTFFDQIVVLSDEVSSKGRIKVKLQDGSEGWVDEKYTTYLPKYWEKLSMIENYYCYTFSKDKIKLHKNEGDDGKMYYYSNTDIDIAMGISFLSAYQQRYDFRQFILKREVQGGRDKKFNWNRELTVGNYKVNYTISTDHPKGGITESFDFVKLNEMTLKKCYTVGIDYMPYDSAKKKLLWRKILFSTLQSLK